jgi:hypothetical protein
MSLKKKSLLLIAIIGVVFAAVVPQYAPGKGKLDFLRYWAATYLFVKGQNAYDSQALRSLEVEASPDVIGERIEAGDDSEAWAPPWTLALLSPLGLIPFDIAVIIWVFFNTTLTGLSAWMTWEMLGRNQDEKGFTLLLAATYWFSSTILLVQIGQISSLLLIGIVLFIYLMNREQDAWAGAVLILLTVKPQITILVLMIIGLWALVHRRWKVIAGFLVSASASLAVTFLISPNWIADYLGIFSKIPATTHSNSTVGSLVEMLTGISWFRYIGILLLPSAFYFYRKIETWGWITTINLSLLLFLPFTLYGYSYDHVVFLLAIAEIIAWQRQKTLPAKRNWVNWGLLAVYLLAILIRFIPGVVYAWTVLPAILLLVVYNFAWKSRRAPILVNSEGEQSHAFNDSI